jgi:hypothetical protein
MTTNFAPNSLTGDAGQHYYEADSSKRRQSIVLISLFLFEKKTLTLSYTIQITTLLLAGRASSTTKANFWMGGSYMGFPMELWSALQSGFRQESIRSIDHGEGGTMVGFL